MPPLIHFDEGAVDKWKENGEREREEERRMKAKKSEREKIR